VLYQCAACQRSFDEPGFCPFDRSPLVAAVGAADKQTILSAMMPAQVDPAHRTELEQRRGTFPLTPTPGPSAPTQEVTAARIRPAAVGAGVRVRSVSATGGAQAALDAYRTPRENEYDRLVGQTLDGKYYVEKKIGEGGMGVVFSARHAVIERPLAIKVLKREVMRDTATIKRFVQEAQAASRIGHPNIVDVTDFGTTADGMTYSVMEFVDGQTLGAAIRHAAPFPPLRAIKIAAQISRALGAAHDKGVIHRDLKPENVFLIDRDGRTDFVKIVDFGIAKVAPAPGSADAPRLTRAGTVFGTPEYMAPEQAAGRGDTDGRVDVYALGVILYEMICGKVPHRGDSMVRTLAMQMLDEIEPPSKVRPDLAIPPELEHVIMTALVKKREQRYQTMSELLRALDQVMTTVGQSITGSPVYALAALPPGADPGVVTSLPPAPLATPTSQPPRSKAPTNRHEPQFVTSSDKPPTFEHVFADTAAPVYRRRWPLVVMILMIVAGGAGAMALVLKSRSSAAPEAPADAGLADAGLAQPALDDAAVIAEVSDASVELDAPADAADIVVVDVDAGVRIRVPRTRDAGVGSAAIVLPDTPNGRGTIMVQVLTKPEGANLYVGTSYRGPGGAQLEEALGTKFQVQCRSPGYKPGKVEVVFDGQPEHEVVLCVLQRIKICINNIKNPFDDCEVDPNKPSGP
jgi:serine/threonine protein kinase